MIKSNYHTHTNFCDGKSTAEEMVKSAIEKNLIFLGFPLILLILINPLGI